jgi:ectoine hydroxylase-related dioxygenase (phytanoyl-CoA dioxygenase family)
MVDVDYKMGPTQIDFTSKFNSVYMDHPTVKARDLSSPEKCHASMKRGSVLIFNANCLHRGTANISRVSRPILVLDTSPPCPHEPESQWDL